MFLKAKVLPRATVIAGGLPLREKLADLRPAEDSDQRPKPKDQKPKTGVSKPLDAPDASAEFNLIGPTTAEAEYELDRFAFAPPDQGGNGATIAELKL